MEASVHISSKEKGALIPFSSPFMLCWQQPGALFVAFSYHIRECGEKDRKEHLLKKNLHLKSK